MSRGVAVVQFTGGEPFLRRDLGELVHYADARGTIVQVSTNGTPPASIYHKNFIYYNSSNS